MNQQSNDKGQSQFLSSGDNDKEADQEYDIRGDLHQVCKIYQASLDQ